LNSPTGQSSDDDPGATLDQNLGKLVGEFRNDPDVPKNIRQSVTRAVLAFRRHLPIALACDPDHRDSVAAAIEAALALGGAMAMRRQVLDGVIDLLNKGRTQKANTVRRRDHIQAIVERRARDFWVREKSRNDMNNDVRTAKKILNAVVADIRLLKSVPKGWEFHELSDPDRKRQFVDNIRKRVARIPPSTRGALVQTGG
jgi:hypothetical protein